MFTDLLSCSPCSFFNRWMQVPTIRPLQERGRPHILNSKYIAWSYFIGVTGMPGKTAYMAWKGYSSAKAGEVVFVNGGAVAVGSYVFFIQGSLRRQKSRPQGLSLAPKKSLQTQTHYGRLREDRVHEEFHYKTTNALDTLQAHRPVNSFRNNAGGKTL
jgi:NADPH-dependent curcumin reductase CurA